MGKKGQTQKDIVGLTPKRLQTILRNFGNNWFNSKEFGNAIQKDNSFTTKRLQLLYSHGWLTRKGARKHYQYRLSAKALKYRREFGTFTSPDGWLMKRWQS